MAVTSDWSLRVARSALLLGAAAVQPAVAQTAPPPSEGGSAAVNGTNALAPNTGPAMEEIVVTAQKRTETLQSVPISIAVLGTQKLAQLNITQQSDLIRFLPTVNVQTLGPGLTRFYFRGIASADNGNHSGPQPTVGVYFDEQPVTTIQGTPDLHLYDIARVEALAGPQGTLYGANAEAGVLRIITNKPDSTKWEAGVDFEGNKVTKGGFGFKTEGFLNAPLSQRAALRVVGWYERDGGFIDIVPGSRSFTNGVTIRTTPRRDINQVDTYGGRLALKVDLDDNWTITPSVQAQEQIAGGRFGYDPTAGDLSVRVYSPERNKDNWIQAAATIEGKIHNLDLVYAGSYFLRAVDTIQDYSDYTFAYDQVFPGFAQYFTDARGGAINPAQRVFGGDRFYRQSHELRISTPLDKPIRAVIGGFYQRQQHNILQDYFISGFAPAASVTGNPGTLWLTQQRRVDRDSAVFGEVTWEPIADHLILTGGARAFWYDNTLFGFFGYGANNPFGSSTGEGRCIAGKPALGRAPCTNLDARAKGDGITPKANITYKFDRDHLVYFTYSRGFRPGGVNRRGGDPYLPDFLTNLEIGTKNQFFDRRLTVNVTGFYGRWKNFQFGFLGQNGLTVIRNLLGLAEVYGAEGELNVAPARGLTLNGGFAYTDATTSADYCGMLATNSSLPQTICVPGNPGGRNNGPAPRPQAPRGSRLPVVPQLKLNATARYSWDWGQVKPYIQGSISHQSSSFQDLRQAEQPVQGRLPAFQQVDFNVGAALPHRITMELFLQNAFDSRGNVSRYNACAPVLRDSSSGVPLTPLCGTTYVVPTRPQTVGIRISKRY